MTGTPGSAPEDGARTRLVFFGSGPFAVPILDALAAAPDHDVAAVVTAPDRAAGRGGRLTPTPVAARARELGLPVLQPASLRDPWAAASIRDLAPRLGILADYGKIVPAAILSIPPAGFLNVHPSLLPRHRGAAPIAGAILAGDPETGVSIMVMDEGLDTGPIVAVERFALSERDTAESVETRAAALATRLLGATIPGWVAGAIRAVPQDAGGATLTRPLRREDGRLDPFLSAEDLERRVRAYLPWPGTFLETADGRLAVLAASISPSDRADRPGALVTHRDGKDLALATVDGRLVLESVRPAGGRTMSGADLLRGRPTLAGAQVTGMAPATTEDRTTTPAATGVRP